MKKSLLLISIWCLIFAGKCDRAGQSPADSTIAKKDTGIAEPNGKAGIGNSTSRDSVKQDSGAQIHGSPDQNKLDSIKNEKLKNKVPK